MKNSQNFMESTKNQTKGPQMEEEQQENINEFAKYEQNKFKSVSSIIS